MTSRYQVSLAGYDYEGKSIASDGTFYYLGMYLALSLVLCVVGTLRYRLLYFASLRASQELFRRMAYSILRAPKRWPDLQFPNMLMASLY